MEGSEQKPDVTLAKDTNSQVVHVYDMLHFSCSAAAPPVLGSVAAVIRVRAVHILRHRTMKQLVITF